MIVLNEAVRSASNLVDSALCSINGSNAMVELYNDGTIVFVVPRNIKNFSRDLYDAGFKNIREESQNKFTADAKSDPKGFFKLGKELFTKLGAKNWR